MLTHCACAASFGLCRRGIEDGQPDFSFAKRSDGTLKEMKGALGGLRVVPGEQNEQELKQLIAEVRVRSAYITACWVAHSIQWIAVCLLL
jgi:hypothetical protein